MATAIEKKKTFTFNINYKLILKEYSRKRDRKSFLNYSRRAETKLTGRGGRLVKVALRNLLHESTEVGSVERHRAVHQRVEENSKRPAINLEVNEQSPEFKEQPPLFHSKSESLDHKQAPLSQHPQQSCFLRLTKPFFLSSKKSRFCRSNGRKRSHELRRKMHLLPVQHKERL